MPIINLVYEAPEQGGWKPGANTRLYLPLNGDSKDPYHNVTYNWSGTASYNTWSGNIQCANFTGSNSINLGTTLDLEWDTGEITFLAWVTVSSMSTQTLAAFHINGSYFWMVGTNSSGNLRYFCRTNSTNSRWYGSTTLSSNTKYLVAITIKENGQIKVYINGNLDGEQNIGTFTSSTFGFGQYIGASYDNGEKYHGNVREVIVENKIWTQAEIQAYYAHTV